MMSKTNETKGEGVKITILINFSTANVLCYQIATYQPSSIIQHGYMYTWGFGSTSSDTQLVVTIRRSLLGLIQYFKI